MTNLSHNQKFHSKVFTIGLVECVLSNSETPERMIMTATAVDGTPWVCEVDAVYNDGEHTYFMSDAGSKFRAPNQVIKYVLTEEESSAIFSDEEIH